MEDPGTGIHAMPFEDYLALDRLNNSGMGHLLRSPYAYQHHRQHPAPPTDAQRLGSVTHVAVLEPERFEREFRRRQFAPATNPGKVEPIALRGLEALEKAAAPTGASTTTKAAKAVRESGRIPILEREWARLEAIAEAAKSEAPAQLISPSDYDVALALRDAVWTSPVSTEAREIIQAADAREVTALWEVRQPGRAPILAKARYDLLLSAADQICDLKTSRDVDPVRFARQCVSDGYHRAAAWYLDGSREAGPSVRWFTFLVVEKSPPYEVAVFRAPSAMIDAGRRAYQEALELFAACRDSGRWPPANEGVQTLPWPPWAS